MKSRIKKRDGAEETLIVELIAQERLAMRARKRVKLVCRQVALDMEYVTDIWMEAIREFKHRAAAARRGDVDVGL